MRLEDVIAIAFLPVIILIFILYVLLKKPKEVQEDPRDKKIRELDKELFRIKND